MNPHETTDLGLASTLVCLGFPIVELSRDNPRRVVFSFDGGQGGFEEAVQGYWDGSLRLPPLALFTHQKQLKQRIYGQQS